MTSTCNYTFVNTIDGVNLVKTKRHLAIISKKITTHNELSLLDYFKLTNISNIKFVEIRDIVVENLIDNA